MFKKGQPVGIPFCNKEGVVEHELDCRDLVGIIVIKAKGIAVAPTLRWYKPQELLAAKEINQYSSKRHPQAEFMLLYAQDAMETDKPWERWEYSNITEWNTCTDNPSWESKFYRRKPKSIRIGNYDVPEPLRVAPAVGTFVYIPAILTGTLSTLSFVKEFGLHDSSYMLSMVEHTETMWLKNGLLHLTKEAAELHAKALLSFTTKGINDE